MRTSPLSRTIRASLCIGALIVTMSAAGGTPAVPNEAKLQALQQQLDELSNQLEQLKSARAAAVQQEPIPSRWSMQSMPGMGARGCGARMRMGSPNGSTWTANAAVLLPEAGSRGAQLVSKYCARCHAPPSPSLHTKEEWTNVTQRMRGHMEALAGAGASVLIPSAADLDALTQYLSNHGTDRSLQ